MRGPSSVLIAFVRAMLDSLPVYLERSGPGKTGGVWAGVLGPSLPLVFGFLAVEVIR
jgi:hypothetical protein